MRAAALRGRLISKSQYSQWKLRKAQRNKGWQSYLTAPFLLLHLGDSRSIVGGRAAARLSPTPLELVPSIGAVLLGPVPVSVSPYRVRGVGGWRSFVLLRMNYSVLLIGYVSKFTQRTLV